MNGRLWYPQLDVYDTVRRMGLLLSAWQEHPPSIERLLIADFYLVNPPLIHKTSMPESVRDEFRQLRVPRPEKTFLSYPAAPILFHRMEPIQRKALQALIGKRVIASGAIRRGTAQLSEFGKSFVEQELAEYATPQEEKLIIFLVTRFAVIGDGNMRDLRRRTGLRRYV